MKKLICLITLLSCIAISESATAQSTTKNYNFGKITKIDASFIYEIYLTEGISNNVKIECPNKFLDIIDVNYSNEKLKLSVKSTKKRRSDDENIKVFLQMKDIYSIDLSGASSLLAKGTFKSNNLEIECSGASNLKGLVISGKRADFDFSGASNAQIDCDFDSIDMETSGACKGDFKLSGNYISLDCSGASNCDINGSIEKVITEVSGASKVYMNGIADKIKINASGASLFNGKNLKANNGYVETSGASTCIVNVIGDLRVSASAASKIIHYGNPNIIDESKSRRIIKGD